MKLSRIFYLLVFVLACFVLNCSFNLFSEENLISEQVKNYVQNNNTNKPNSIVMYECLEKYSKEYEIPKHIIYNLAYMETTYRGPFDFDYNHKRTSCVGALGPMQIMPNTAKLVNKKKINNFVLKNNIDYNVKTSAKLLKQLHDKYGDWKIVCGCYNTGRPIINSYAEYCVQNKSYRNKWVNLEL